MHKLYLVIYQLNVFKNMTCHSGISTYNKEKLIGKLFSLIMRPCLSILPSLAENKMNWIVQYMNMICFSLSILWMVTRQQEPAVFHKDHQVSGEIHQEHMARLTRNVMYWSIYNQGPGGINKEFPVNLTRNIM